MTPEDRDIEVADSGTAAASRNAEIDAADLAACARGERAGRLRFHASLPAASIGAHQALEREVRVEYCRAHGIETVRRGTSGGALYLDPGQFAFTLTVRRPQRGFEGKLAGVLARAAEAVASGLRRLGIAAGIKPPNDVEVGGRKIASVYVARSAGAAQLQAVLLRSVDVETMLKALRVPTEKLSPDGLAGARERLTSIESCCALPPGPEEIARALVAAFAGVFALRFDATVRPVPMPALVASPAGGAGSPDPAGKWSASRRAMIETRLKAGAVTLRARADFGSLDRCLDAVEIATDAHFEPGCFLRELERSLEGEAPARIGHRVGSLAGRLGFDAAGIEAADIERLLVQLVEQHRFARACGLDAAQASALMPVAGADGPDTAAVLKRAAVMLVPYCAKPAWCKWRHRDGCSECGLCEAGAAYGLARAHGMRVTTVTNYEHLVAVLAVMKEAAVPAYIGMCCGNFFLKRYRAFADAGIPALLMDISGSNCYELGTESEAYAGTFRAEARLDARLLERVMRFVPPRG